jgi:nitroimidazol reductase NimA-like FMN-containing flavoprotein (pyridoxamine 5'-phosphate oxidase superfamily)
MDKSLRKKVEVFLAKHLYCSLSTCSKSSPHATVVMYASRGLDLYFFTGTSTKKLRNIDENNRVAAAIEGRRLLFFPQALEMQGEAQILSGREAELARRLYFSKHRPEFLLAKKIAETSDIR